MGNPTSILEATQNSNLEHCFLPIPKDRLFSDPSIPYHVYDRASDIKKLDVIVPSEEVVDFIDVFRVTRCCIKDCRIRLYRAVAERQDAHYSFQNGYNGCELYSPFFGSFLEGLPDGWLKRLDLFLPVLSKVDLRLTLRSVSVVRIRIEEAEDFATYLSIFLALPYKFDIQHQSVRTSEASGKSDLQPLSSISTIVPSNVPPSWTAKELDMCTLRDALQIEQEFGDVSGIILGSVINPSPDVQAILSRWSLEDNVHCTEDEVDPSEVAKWNAAKNEQNDIDLWKTPVKYTMVSVNANFLWIKVMQLSDELSDSKGVLQHPNSCDAREGMLHFNPHLIDWVVEMC